MAIGSVVDLIDYEKRTIEIAKKYGGGGGGTGDVSKSIIAPNWNKLTTYHYGDMVWYQDKLYACKLPVLAGDESNSNPDSNVTEWYQDVNVDFANTLNVKNENDYLKSKEIASEYDPTSTSAISVGSYRTHKTFNVSSGVYENVLYKCITPVKVTAGAFDETMWTEYLSYDPSNTYNTGDYATYEVDGTNKCFRCNEDNVTGEWDISKWTDVSETEFPSYNYTNIYYPSVSKVALRYPGSYRYFIANATYEPTGTIGEWDPLKWSNITLSSDINALKPIPVFVPQFTTDANGCVWLESPAMEGIREPFGIIIKHDNAFDGFTGRVEVIHKYISDGAPTYTNHDYIGFKFYDGNGDALTNWDSVRHLGMTAGIGFLYYNANQF